MYVRKWQPSLFCPSFVMADAKVYVVLGALRFFGLKANLFRGYDSMYFGFRVFSGHSYLQRRKLVLRTNLAWSRDPKVHFAPSLNWPAMCERLPGDGRILLVTMCSVL